MPVGKNLFPTWCFIPEIVLPKLCILVMVRRCALQPQLLTRASSSPASHNPLPHGVLHAKEMFDVLKKTKRGK